MFLLSRLRRRFVMVRTRALLPANHLLASCAGCAASASNAVPGVDVLAVETAAVNISAGDVAARLSPSARRQRRDISFCRPLVAGADSTASVTCGDFDSGALVVAVVPAVEAPAIGTVTRRRAARLMAAAVCGAAALAEPRPPRSPRRCRLLAAADFSLPPSSRRCPSPRVTAARLAAHLTPP